MARLCLLAAIVLVARGQLECALTKRPAKEPRYLKFCQDYNQEACCIPGHDMENQLQFENLIDGLGPGCKNPMMYPAIRYYYCLGCDPQQPEYTNESAQQIRVCKSFVDRIWRDGGKEYEECGVMKSNDCPASWGDNDFDPYMCGDDLIIPNKEDITNTADKFMNFFKPPGLDDYTFVEVPDDDPAGCWTAKAFSSPAATLSSSGSLLAACLAASALLLLR
eukprot:Transcript_24557.p1 GENE.Transcript_24557~~Transcript_24557.p1  ORF type:complete len:221 (-),score=85.33 Transcript_24557:847-1509(-)